MDGAGMKIGILSDTHGSVRRTRVAAELMAAEQVEAVIHCGDVGAAAVLVELAEIFDPLEVPVHAVLGNVDHYDRSVSEFPNAAHIFMHGREAILDLGGLRIAVAHGDDSRGLDDLIDSGQYDLVCTGHTHKRKDEQAGSTRVVNPGAIYRADIPGFAILETPDLLRYIDLPSERI